MRFNERRPAMTECKERKAVGELLQLDDAENFIETLDDMFETWIGSELVNGTTGSQRYNAMMHIKALKKLMNSIK
jgi:hypothetical protein